MLPGVPGCLGALTPVPVFSLTMASMAIWIVLLLGSLSRVVCNVPTLVTPSLSPGNLKSGETVVSSRSSSVDS